MSWISDVRSELKGLDTSKKSLRSFGLLVGLIFMAIAVLFYLRHSTPWSHMYAGLLVCSWQRAGRFFSRGPPGHIQGMMDLPCPGAGCVPCSSYPAFLPCGDTDRLDCKTFLAKSSWILI